MGGFIINRIIEEQKNITIFYRAINLCRAIVQSDKMKDAKKIGI